MRGVESQVRERVAALVGRADAAAPGPVQAGPDVGWVPAPPGGAAASPPPPTGADKADSACEGDAESADAQRGTGESGAALRARALGSAMVAYTAVHGHPLEAAELEPPRRRWGVAKRAAVVAAAALLVVTGVVAARASRPAPSVVVPASSAPGSGPTTQPEVVVHVVGEVTRPGLVRLREGSRVADAVAAAGGATSAADLASVNLARLLVDGEQLVVPGPGAPAGEGTGSASQPAQDDRVDLNSADVTALDALPGIGPVLAQRIVDWRSEHGRFSVVDELAEVQGIGPALLDGVRELVRVG